MTATKTMTTQQRSKMAQTELTKLANAFCRALLGMKQDLKGSETQSAGAVALQYLEIAGAKHEVEQLGHIAPRLLIEDGRQGKLLAGALTRANNALTYLGGGSGDPFEQAQVLVQAATGLAARLSERGLLLPELPKEAEYRTQVVAHRVVPPDTTFAQFSCAA